MIAGSEFKLKYAGSVFGYAWSVIKPLALFTVLYLVFARVFKLGSISDYYGVSLLIGIVLFGFFSDATSLGMTSLVARESLLRKLVFPRLVIPMAATITAGLTFLVNSVVVAGFVAWEQITPRLDWLLVIPLLVELYGFALGLALILATLFVRFRDMGQVWELGLQLLFYASPIIYPIGFLPPFARDLVFLNPFTQVLQDIRALVLYPDLPGNTITAGRGVRDVRPPDPDRDRGGNARRRPPAVQAGRAVVRGARVSRPVIEVSGVSKAFRLPHERRTTLKEHVLHPFDRTTLRGAAGARRRELHRPRGRVLRDHRAERQRQEHAAQDPRRDLPAGLRNGARRRPAVALHRARRRVQPRAHAHATTSGSTARSSDSGSASSRSASTGSSSSPASSASSTRS